MIARTGMRVDSLRKYLRNPELRNRNISIMDRDGNEYVIVGFCVNQDDPNYFTILIGKKKREIA
jgi:hypothetical protein